MAVSLTLDRHLVTVEPSDTIAGRRFTLDLDEVGAQARELEVLVDAARQLVTVDPSWALWALECAVDAEFLDGEDAAMSLMAAAFDSLYLGERRVPARELRLDGRVS